VNIERITWRDSAVHNDGGWIALDEVRDAVRAFGALECKTAGFVVDETPDVVTVATSYSCDADGAPARVVGALTIPVSAIERRESLDSVEPTGPCGKRISECSCDDV
jgi:hypothetical protein